MADAPRPSIITRDEIPEWERRAAAAGQVLDRWFPVDGDDQTLAVRLVDTIEERDVAQVHRSLNHPLPALT